MAFLIEYWWEIILLVAWSTFWCFYIEPKDSTGPK